jgi:hypothetical protein
MPPRHVCALPFRLAIRLAIRSPIRSPSLRMTLTRRDIRLAVAVLAGSVSIDITDTSGRRRSRDCPASACGSAGPRRHTIAEVASPPVQVGGMRQLGYIEGKNDEYELRSAEDRIVERAGPITEELIAKGADVRRLRRATVSAIFVQHLRPVLARAQAIVRIRHLLITPARPRASTVRRSARPGMACHKQERAPTPIRYWLPG